MAVFVWGLQYKLSLYHSQDKISHAGPEAKLLSQKERPVTGGAVEIQAPPAPLHPGLPALLLVATLTGLSPAAVRYFRLSSPPRSVIPPGFFLHALFFRPPPTR
jgi:hypothetical protein